MYGSSACLSLEHTVRGGKLIAPYTELLALLQTRHRQADLEEETPLLVPLKARSHPSTTLMLLVGNTQNELDDTETHSDLARGDVDEEGLNLRQKAGAIDDILTHLPKLPRSVRLACDAI